MGAWVRIRQVKPEFWRDSRLADLSDTTKLVFIGLWMQADDTGWFRADVVEIATDLYPYQSRPAREKRVQTAVDDLARTGRIVLAECGHGEVPNLTRHQRLSSPDKRVTTVWREHERCLPAETRGDPRGTYNAPTRNGTVRNGKEREVGGVGGAPLAPYVEELNEAVKRRLGVAS